MQTASKPVPKAVEVDVPLPVSTFKASLRDWQARYKARRASEAPVPAKENNQTTPA